MADSVARDANVTGDAMKEVLRKALGSNRTALMWKLEGLSERDLRMPRTPTGLNLLGIVKHMANVEIGYFGETFGRSWPDPREIVSDEVFDTNPQADWYATEEETAEGIIDLYRRVWAFTDLTFDELDLDSPGVVPHWPAPRNAVNLGEIMVHVLADLTRHVGQADIAREGIDGAVGMQERNTNIPEGQDWSGYVSMLKEIAEKSSR